MHVSLVAAGLIATSAIVLYAAMPFHVSSLLTPEQPKTDHFRAEPPALQQGPARRQSDTGTGTITGEVRDALGSPVAGAVVDAVHRGGTWRALARAR